MSTVRLRQGQLIGRMEALGFPQRNEAEIQTLTQDVVKSSEIEGEILEPDQVRSSIARRLGMDAGAVHPTDRRVDGVVEMVMEATQHYSAPLSKARLFSWHQSLFPDSSSKMTVGNWRDGPVQVVSGALGHRRVHFEGPSADRVDMEMKAFFDKVNQDRAIDPILRAGLAHLWFVTIHPFEDGNGRIARAIADWALARSEGSAKRYYSMSAQIRRERDHYYDILEQTQKGPLDITGWLSWFVECMGRALSGTESFLSDILRKDAFWKRHAQTTMNARQRSILNKMLDGEFFGKLTSTKWAKMTKCSQDTASRDLQELAGKGILIKDGAGGRSTSYTLVLKSQE